VHRFRHGFPWFASGLISSQNTFGSEALLNTFGSEVDFLPNVDKILGKPDRVKSSQLTDFDAE